MHVIHKILAQRSAHLKLLNKPSYHSAPISMIKILKLFKYVLQLIRPTIIDRMAASHTIDFTKTINKIINT